MKVWLAMRLPRHIVGEVSLGKMGEHRKGLACDQTLGENGMVSKTGEDGEVVHVLIQHSANELGDADSIDKDMIGAEIDRVLVYVKETRTIAGSKAVS